MWSKSTICQVKQQTIQLPLSGRSQKVMEKLSPCVQYTVGKWDSGTVGQWTEMKKIRDVSMRKLKIALERGKVYQFAITATNELG